MFRRLYIATHRLPRSDRLLTPVSAPVPTPVVRSLQEQGIAAYDALRQLPPQLDTVYCILGRGDLYFTCPFHKKFKTQEERPANVLLMLACPSMAEAICRALRDAEINPARRNGWSVKAMDVHDASYHAMSVLRVPYVIVTEARCDLEEKPQPRYVLYYGQRDVASLTETIAQTSDLEVQNIIDLLLLMEEHGHVLEDVFYEEDEEDDEDDDML